MMTLAILEHYFIYSLLGAFVGAMVGCTGVGGAALMTPALILLGQPPSIAIGTDLLFAFLTKIFALRGYYKHDNIDYKIALLICLGSIPACLIGISLLHYIGDLSAINKITKHGVGIVLLITSLSLFTQNIFRIENLNYLNSVKIIRHHRKIWIVVFGFILGTIVTFTSIGAGSLGMVILLFLYNDIPLTKLVGTDLAQALIIALVGAIGYGSLGSINYILLFFLLLGSLPTALFISDLSRHIPEKLIRFILAILLALAGVQFLRVL
jgi:uncharacterized membrane protein YfcA